jgi:signal transduction histidine kinase
VTATDFRARSVREAWAARARVPRGMLVLAALATVATIVPNQLHAQIAGEPVDWLGWLILVAGPLSLVAADRRPVEVLLFTSGVAVVYDSLDYPGGFYTVSIVIAVFVAVRAGQRVPTMAVVITLIAVMFGIDALWHRGHEFDLQSVAFFAGWLGGAFALGESSRSRRAYLAAVEQRAVQAERTREEEARRRAGEERLRIARELHDVIAHNISLINVQSGVAAHLLDKNPQQARPALDAINRASDDALRELRSTLGVLRQLDEGAPRAPAPSLDDLEGLVEATSKTGLDIQTSVAGAERKLPGGLDLAAYRIVQESLTNVTRHSGASRAWVRLDYARDEIVITVDDDGQGMPDGQIARGNGLPGMRERASAVGGRLEAGNRPEGGFRVRAQLPLKGTT